VAALCRCLSLENILLAGGLLIIDNKHSTDVEHHELHRSVLCPGMQLEYAYFLDASFFIFFRNTTCDLVFDHWETIPSEILKSRANRFARRENLTRVSGIQVQRTDLCVAKSARICEVLHSP